MEFWKGLIHLDDLQRVIELMEYCEAGKTSDFKAEYRMRTKSGEWKWILDWGKIVARDNNDKPLRAAGTHLDITERKKAEEALSISEERYRGLSEAAFESIFISEKGVCLEQNSAAEKMFSYTLSEAIGRKGTEWIVLKDREMVMNNMLSGYEDPYEATALRKDGTTFPCEIQARMMHYRGREVRVTALYDITERKRAEEILLKSERRLKNAQELSKIGDYEWELDTAKIIWSDGLYKLFGFSIGSHITKEKLFKHIHPDDLRFNIKNMKKWFKEGGGKPYEYRIIRADGAVRNIYEECDVVYNEKGKAEKLFGVVHDITERKRAEQKLQESEEKFRYLVKNSNDVFVIIDENGKETFVSDSVERITGFTTAETIGHSGFEFLHPDDVDHMSKTLSKLLKTPGAIVQAEYRHRRKDGGWVYLEAIGNNYLDEPSIKGIVLNVRDITERKRAEKELREYSKSQAILIKEINHRVRNNLSEIISVLYSEQELAERKGKLEYISNIDNIIMRIKGLSTVHSMLSESKWKPLKITHLCERIVNEVIKSLSSSRDVNLLVTSSDFLISSNKAHYLGMVINELATNSIKYAFNNRDKLNINIDIKEEDDNIVLNYSDDGLGYPIEILKEGFSKEGIGFELIQGIVKQSLLGELELRNENGAVTIITFKNIQ